MTGTVVLYHDDCLDGYTAAWIVARHVDPEARLVACQYDRPLPVDLVDIVGRRVIVADFSFPPEVMDVLCQHAEVVEVYDHHATAIDQLAGYWHPHYSARSTLDADRCGSRILWDELVGTPAPRFVELIEDQDLWRHAEPETAGLVRWLTSGPYSLDRWDVADADPATIAAAEPSAADYRENMIGRLIAEARMMDMVGYTVPVVNCPEELRSDIGNRLAKDYPFAATYFDAADQRRWSLRSIMAEGGLNVREIAERFGGGGHAEAAGFRTKHNVMPGD